MILNFGQNLDFWAKFGLLGKNGGEEGGGPFSCSRNIPKTRNNPFNT